MTDYREEITRLKAERNETRYKEIAEDILYHDRQRLEAEQAAQDAVARGDTEGARYLIENAEQAEQSIARLSADLDQLDASAGGQQAGQLSEAKRAWIERRQDLVNPQTIEAAGAWHNHLVGTLGYQDDSPEYFSAMQTVLEPQGYEPVITPDEVCERLGLKPEEYNKQVEKLWRRKAAGEYPDR
jgi:hypothetical protein